MVAVPLWMSLEQQSCLLSLPLYPRGSLSGPCTLQTLGFRSGQSQLKLAFIMDAQMMEMGMQEILIHQSM